MTLDRPRRRWRWGFWVPFALAIGALWLLPQIFVAPMIAARLSRTLGTRVEIGGVGIEPIDAVVLLYDVTVQAPPQPGGSTHASPVIVAERVRVDVQWLPLIHKTLLVRELAFESARVALDRLPGGNFSLETFGQTNPAGELPSGWTFALDRIALRDSQIQLRDLSGSDSESFAVGLRDAEFSTRRRRASAFGRVPNLQVDAVVRGGRIRVDGSYDVRDEGPVLDALIRAKDVPLAHLRPYLPDFGWTDLKGRASGQLRYQREPHRRDILTGRLMLRRVAIEVPGMEDAAVAVRKALVDIDRIDLLRRRVAIGSLTLHGPTVAARPAATAITGWLEQARATTKAKQGRRPASTKTEPVPEWSWLIERFATSLGRLRVPTAQGDIDVRASVSGENLGPAAYWSPLRARFTRGKGEATFDGTTRVTHGLLVEGHLKAGGLDVPTLAEGLGLPWADLARAGTATADLTIELEPGAKRGRAFDVRGALALRDVWFAGPDPSVLAFGALGIDLTLAGMVLAGEDGRAGAASELRVSDAVLGSPFVLLTRTAEGWALPPFEPLPIAAVAGETAPVDPPSSGATESAGSSKTNVASVSSSGLSDLLPLPKIQERVRKAMSEARTRASAIDASARKRSTAAANLEAVRSAARAAAKSAADGTADPNAVALEGTAPSEGPAREALAAAEKDDPRTDARTGVSRSTLEAAKEAARASTAEASADPAAREDVSASASTTAGGAASTPKDDAAPLNLAIAALRTRSGRLLIVDEVVTPSLLWDVDYVEGSVRNLHLPAFTFTELGLRGNESDFGVMQLAGNQGPATSTFEVWAESFPLSEATPYLERAGLPYEFAAGTGSFLSRVSVGLGRWSAETDLTLRQPIFASGEDALQHSLGMPLTEVFSLLRGSQGDVTLHLPLASPRADAWDGFSESVAAAVRDEIWLAREAAPIEVAFPNGRADLRPQAMDQLASIGRIAATRNGLIVELDAPLSANDRRFLEEQELSRDLQDRGGVMSVLSLFGVRDSQERIRDALAERAVGRRGWLDANDEEDLEDLLAERPRIPLERVISLNEMRLMSITDFLANQYGVPRTRVHLGTKPDHESPGPPTVRVRVARAPLTTMTLGPRPVVPEIGPGVASPGVPGVTLPPPPPGFAPSSPSGAIPPRTSTMLPPPSGAAPAPPPY